MDIVRLDQLISGMRPEVAGCEAGMMLQALRRASREFFRRSGAWSLTLDTFDAVAEQASYTLPLGGIQAIVDSIDAVRLNTASGVSDGNDGYAVDPNYYYLTPPLTLTFTEEAIPPESVTDGLEVDVRLIPTLDAVELPAVIFARYAEGLRAKALADLKRMTGLPWFDPQGAARFITDYNNILNRSMSDNARGFKTSGGGLEA